MTRLASIDLLRSFACLAVVLFHYLSRGPAFGYMEGLNVPWLEPIARYGYLGVHLFFIISGFVILWSANDASPRSFFASRFARLYPAFWVAVPLTVAVVWLSGDTTLVVPLTHAIGNMTMFPHWFGLSYVDGAYWSLAVELHFYIYIWIALRMRIMRWLEYFLAAWLVVSFIDLLRPIYLAELWLNAKWAPYFTAGCVLYLLKSKGVTWQRILLLVASWVLSVVWTASESLKGLKPDMPFNPLVVGAAITMMFAIVSVVTLSPIRIRSNRLTLTVGALTYPVYLVHENIGYVLHAKLLKLSGNTWLSLMIVVIIVVITSWGIYKGVERQLGPWLRRWIGGVQ